MTLGSTSSPWSVSPVNGRVMSSGPGRKVWISGPSGIWIPPGIGLGAGETRGGPWPWACAAGIAAPTVAAAPVAAPYLKRFRRLMVGVAAIALPPSARGTRWWCHRRSLRRPGRAVNAQLMT
jgi:hypothetical protein